MMWELGREAARLTIFERQTRFSSSVSAIYLDTFKTGIIYVDPEPTKYLLPWYANFPIYFLHLSNEWK